MNQPIAISIKRSPNPMSLFFFRLYITLFNIIAKSSIPVLSLIIINRILMCIIFPDYVGNLTLDIETPNVFAMPPYKIAMLVSTFVQYWIMVCFIISYTSDICRYGKASFRKSLILSTKRAHAVFVAFFIYLLLVVAGSILLLIPGLYCLAAFSMFINVIILENKGIVAAFKRSKSLTTGSRIFVLLSIVASYCLPSFFCFRLSELLLQKTHSIFLHEVTITITLYLTYTIFLGTFLFLYEELKLRQMENLNNHTAP